MKNKEKYFDWFDYKFFIVFALFFLPLAVVNKNIIYKFDIYKNISIDYHSNNNPYSMSVEFLEFAKLLPFDLVILNDPYGKYPLNIYFPVYTTTQVPFASSKDQISRNMVSIPQESKNAPLPIPTCPICSIQLTKETKIVEVE